MRGHPILTPEREKIRVPWFAIRKMQDLSLLEKTKDQGKFIYRILPQIYHLLLQEFDTLNEGLRHLLGGNCDGPEWSDCDCDKCKEGGPVRRGVWG